LVLRRRADMAELRTQFNAKLAADKAATPQLSA
jgi:hypothetical protein